MMNTSRLRISIGTLVVVLSLLCLGQSQTPPRREEFNPGVRAPGIGPNSIDIIWSNSPRVGSIQRVYISAQYHAPCVNVTVPTITALLEAPSSNIYTVTGLEEYSTYLINVTLVSSRGVGSDVIMEQTTGTFPPQLQEFRFDRATTTSITVTWDPTPCLLVNSIIEQYILHLTPLTTLTPPRTTTLTFSTPRTSFTAHNLTLATTYNITLDVTYSFNNIDPPVTTRIAPPILARTFEIPGPYALNSSATSSEITLSWQQELPATNLTQYTVEATYIRPCPSLVGEVIGGTIPLQETSYTFQGLRAFGIYNLTVNVVATSNQTATSSILKQTQPEAPTSSPQSVRATNVEAFSLTVSWEPVPCERARSAIVSYTVHYFPQFHPTQQSNVSGIFNFSLSLTGLEPSTLYILQVEGVNAEGDVSPRSIPVSVPTAAEPQPPENLRVMSTGSTWAVLAWDHNPGSGYTLVSTFLGPCTDTQVPTLTMSVGAELGGSANVTGLQEFSTYHVAVTPAGGRLPANISLSTLAADPTPADDHVIHMDTSFTSVVLQAPEIPCIDQNGDISEFRIRYAKSSDFIANVEIRNGVFSPGLVILGNLDSGTDYTIQLIIVTAEGGSVGLEPITVRTYGIAPRPPLTLPPPPPPTAPPTTQTRSNTANTVATVVILVGGVTALIVIAGIVLVCVGMRRRGQAEQGQEDRKKLVDEDQLKRLSSLEEAEQNPFGQSTGKKKKKPERKVSKPGKKDKPAPLASPFHRGWSDEEQQLSPGGGQLRFSKFDWMGGFRKNPVFEDTEDEDIDMANFEPRAEPSTHVYADGEEDLDEAMFEPQLEPSTHIYADEEDSDEADSEEGTFELQPESPTHVYADDDENGEVDFDLEGDPEPDYELTKID